MRTPAFNFLGLADALKATCKGCKASRKESPSPFYDLNGVPTSEFSLQQVFFLFYKHTTIYLIIERFSKTLLKDLYS